MRTYFPGVPNSASRPSADQINVSIYEQTCFGVLQFRLMRDDGYLIMDAHQIDFPTEDEAKNAVINHFRRTSVENYKITAHRQDNQANGRRRISVVVYEVS